MANDIRIRRRRLIGVAVLVIIIAGVFSALVSAIWAMNSWITVPQGYALLVADTTKPESEKITGPFLGPIAGFFLDGFKRMIGQQYPITIYYATDVYQDNIPCFSSDQLEMNITVQMRWQLNTSKLIDLYKSYPRLDYEVTAIDSIMEETIRLITKNFTALETIDRRDTVAELVQVHVFDKISREPSLVGALSYLTFDLKNIGYPSAYTAAIEQKLIAEQQKLQSQQERERIIILANATAQELILKAEGEAQAKILLANSTQQAIRMIIQASGADPGNATRIAELYLWVEALKQIAPNIDKFFMFVGQDGTPILIPVDGQTPP